jgi:hypothetical protein
MNEKERTNAIKLMPSIVKQELAANRQLLAGIGAIEKNF